MKQILLIGPGTSIETLNPHLLKTIPSLYFGSNFKWFEKNNICPTYWTFIEPNTITYFDALINGISSYDNTPSSKRRYDYESLISHINNTPSYNSEFLKNLKESTTLIYNDIQGSKDYYENGFSTSRGDRWFQNEFKQDVLPRVESCFKETKIISTILTLNSYSSLSNEETKHISPIIKWDALNKYGDLENTDKFTSWLLPLIISQFPLIKKIKSIGLGDFNTTRYGTISNNHNNIDTYHCYKKHFNFMKSKLIDLLGKKDIEIEFLNKDSYFKELETPKMDKITYCIPSKSNLRYLKTCIPSIRKNSYRNDHDIIIFVDSDEDGTVEWLEQVKDEYGLSYYVNPKLGEELFGIGKAYDYCIEKSTTNIFMIFHADMMLGKNADLNAYKQLKSKSVICATRVEPPLHPNGGEKILLDFGMWPEEFKEKEFEKYVSEHLEDTKVTEGIFAPWMMYKKDFLEILGGHDPVMHSCREDSDLFNRMLLAGFKFLQPWNSLVYHLTGRGAGSFDGDSERHEKWKKAMNDSTLEFIRKWGTNVNHTLFMKPIVSPVYKKNIIFTYPNIQPQLKELLEPWFNGGNDIIVEVDGNKFTNEDYQIIQKLNDIIKDSGEIGKFELGNLKITINNLSSYEKDLIKI